jgi:hypothetical protein
MKVLLMLMLSFSHTVPVVGGEIALKEKIDSVEG